MIRALDSATTMGSWGNTPASATELHPPFQEGVLFDGCGTLTATDRRAVEGGTLYLGTYATDLATHRVGVYAPENPSTTLRKPVVGMTTPLGTGNRGHNHNVAMEMMQDGAIVIKKGPPRYYRPTVRALSIEQDEGEVFRIINAVEQAGLIPEDSAVAMYGESQGAMKALMAPKLGAILGREVTTILPVAPCFLDRIQWHRPDRQLRALVNVTVGLARQARAMSREEITAKRGTFSRKDLHHHVIVLPVLTSGEAGDALPHIPPEQEGQVLVFGRDGWSQPRKTKARLERETNLEVHLFDEYGHVDGILSQETSQFRHDLVRRLHERIQAA